MKQKRWLMLGAVILFFLVTVIGDGFGSSNRDPLYMATRNQFEVPSCSKHHESAELGCDDCHPTDTPKPLGTESCVSCHGSFKEIAQATDQLDPNPHNSPHYGEELDCSLCHHEHSESENFCAQCHDWELEVP